MNGKRFRTGDFARETGVSVRTIRYYDRLGLLSPAARTESGYREYSADDLTRLQQILALKFLGFSLAEIRQALDAPRSAPIDMLTHQEAMLRAQRARLDRVVLAAAEARRRLNDDDTNWQPVVDLIGVIQMEQQGDWRKKYFTHDQIAATEAVLAESYSPEAAAKLAARGEWSEADQQRVDEQYAALYAGVKAAVADGLVPASATGQTLAGQAWELIDVFTMGDPEIMTGLQKAWQTCSAMPVKDGPYQTSLTDEETAFLDQAKTHHRSCQP